MLHCGHFHDSLLFQTMVSISELLALKRLKVKTHEHVLIRNYNDNGWGCDGRKLASVMNALKLMAI